MALNELIRTTEGYNLLSRYAKAGDEVAGIKFDKDGDLHKAGVDLVLTASDSKVGGASGGTESKIINGRLKNTVNIENGSKYIGDALETQGHELFIHALPKSLDFADDKNLILVLAIYQNNEISLKALDIMLKTMTLIMGFLSITKKNKQIMQT